MKFDGRATIRVRFRNRASYQKFREEILHTKWTYDLDIPMWEELTLDFHNVDDVNNIVKHIVMLLQAGFEVYCCRFQLEQDLAEDEHPLEEDHNMEEDLKEFNLERFVTDLWTKLGKQ